jgi:hypothetical protein
MSAYRDYTAKWQSTVDCQFVQKPVEDPDQAAGPARHFAQSAVP